MRRGTILLLALLFSFALAASSFAVPLLVELKIRDPLTAITIPASEFDDAVVSGGNNGHDQDKSDKSNNGKGGSQGSPGKNQDPLSKANLKSLSLWLSKDGKSWKMLDAEIMDLSNEKITARFGTKSGSDPSEIGLPSGDESYFIGVSTSSTSFSGSAYSAPLLSWNVTSKSDSRATSAPEPGIWPLLGIGALGIGFALHRRKRA